MSIVLERITRGAAVLVLLAGAVALSAAQDEAVSHGQMLYDMHCAKCHGDEGKGDGPLARNFDHRATDLTQLAAKSQGVFPREMLRQVIDGRTKVAAHETPDMPVWGETFARQADLGQAASEIEKVVDERIDHLLSYLETLQAKK